MKAGQVFSRGILAPFLQQLYRGENMFLANEAPLMHPTWIAPSCGSVNSNCNYVGRRLLTVTFYNEKCTLQNSIPSHGFFDLKDYYGNKTTPKIDTSSADHLYLDTKAGSDSCDYWRSNSALCMHCLQPFQLHLINFGVKYLGATNMATHIHRTYHGDSSWVYS